MVVDTFQTARLRARKPSRGDLPFFREIHSDINVMKTLSADGSTLDEEASESILEAHLEHWRKHGYGIWLFEWQPGAGDGIVGYCGLRSYMLREVEETELYFGVRSRYFRRGLGTEMAQAVCRIAFETLERPSVIGFTLEDNVASRTLMMKLGMKYEGLIEHAGLPHVTYRRLR